MVNIEVSLAESELIATFLKGDILVLHFEIFTYTFVSYTYMKQRNFYLKLIFTGP